MTAIPNIYLVEGIVKKLASEYDLEARYSRYKSLNPELIAMAITQGLHQEDYALRALFISDFIITSSEVPTGTTDDERRFSIISSFKHGIEQHGADADSLLNVMFLCQGVSQMVRRSDYFLAGRGLDRTTALLILKDLYISPFLELIKMYLGSGEQWWGISMIWSALTKELPDRIYHKIINSKPDNVSRVIWEMMTAFKDTHSVSINEMLSIPNINASSIIYLSKFSKLPQLSIYNFSKIPDSNEKRVINDFLGYFNKTDKNNPISYIRAKIKDNTQTIIIIRQPMMDGKPLLLIKTEADEVNLSEVLALLQLRSFEGEFWQNIEYTERKFTTKVEKVIQEDVVETYDTVENYMVEEEIEGPKNFLSKIKSVFSRKPKTQVVSKQRTKQATRVVKRKTKKTEKKDKIISHELPSFISKGLGVLSLGSLNLFEIFDIERGGDYRIVGVIDSDSENNSTSILVESSFNSMPSLNEILEGLSETIESTINYFSNEKIRISLSEVLFTIDEDYRMIISLDSNKERVVGLLAVSYKKEMANWKISDQIPPIKRRTLLMRTNQLLSARSHTPFDTSVARILGDDLMKDCTLTVLDKSILK